MVTIYMPLQYEGTDDWRPVQATRLSSGGYRVEGTIPEGEEWAFAPGAVVRCEKRSFSGAGAALAAVRIAD